MLFTSSCFIFYNIIYAHFSPPPKKIKIKQSIDFHESGKRHHESVRKNLEDVR